MRVAPGHAPLHAIKILYQDRFLAPRQLIPPLLTTFARGRRDTAPVLFLSFIYRDHFPAVYLTCTATPPSLRYGGQSAPARNKNCTMTAKTRAIPSLRRDYFPARTTDVVQSGGPAKVPGHFYQFFG